MKATLEELIKLAERDEPSKKESTLKSDVERFLVVFDIKEGHHKVKPETIFRSYKMWAGNTQRANSFYMHMSKFFKLYSRPSRHYKLNYRPIELLNTVDNSKIRIK